MQLIVAIGDLRVGGRKWRTCNHELQVGYGACVPPSHRPPRQPRIANADLREMVLAAGRSLLAEMGVSNGATHLTFKRVFAYIVEHGGPKLTNAQVYGRLWPSVEAFQLDVLADVARTSGLGDIRSTAEVVLPILEAADTSTVTARRRVLRELVRVGAAENAHALGRSREWITFLGISSLAATGALEEGADAELAAAIREGYAAAAASVEELYLYVLDALHFRVRDGLSLRQFTVSAAALVEGLSLRGLMDPSALKPVMRPTGPGDAMQEWHPYAVALEALVDAYVEPDTKRRRVSDERS